MMNLAFRLRAYGQVAASVICCVLFSAIALVAAAGGDALDLSLLKRIEVQPQALELHGPRDRAIVLVTGYFPNGVVVDLTRQAQITSANTAVVRQRDAEICATGG